MEVCDSYPTLIFKIKSCNCLFIVFYNKILYFQLTMCLYILQLVSHNCAYIFNVIIYRNFISQL